MVIKKYPQSHLVIIGNNTKIVIDPGYITFEKGFKVEEFQGADAYLITHQHPDHLDTNTIKQVVGESLVFGNFDVCAKLAEVGVKATEVKDKQSFEAAGFKITPFNLPHFQKPNTIMPPNTGFLIDGAFFHPGDGWRIEEVSAEKAAVPISGPPDGEIGFEQALTLAKSLGAKVVIPIHYDKYPADPNEFSELAGEQGIRVIALAAGEEVEL